MSLYKDIAPIVLFCYNRPDHVRQTLDALKKNDLASESILYIFCDGPKGNSTKENLQKIEETRKIVKSKKWCKEVHVLEELTNKGLADSIISGVSTIVNQYGKVIVLEDDLVTSKGFLKYMNDALTLYKDVEQVLHISGYMYPHKENLPDTFFYGVTMCWGWGTWSRAWKNYSNDATYLWKNIIKKGDSTDFDKFGGTYLSSQLFGNIAGDLKTWFIKWNASVYLINGLTLFPNKSLVQNIGHDGTGENCENDCRFKNELNEYINVSPIDLVESKNVKNIISNFLHAPQVANNTINTRSHDWLFFIKKNKYVNIVLEKFTNYFFQRISFRLENINNLQKINRSYISKKAKIFNNSTIGFSVIQEYTYIAQNSIIHNTSIGKFCSIGPNLISGWGIHPTNGISTSPMFYSTLKQNGITLSSENKIEELKAITIGNDVFIGMNVTILDGVNIGDGAIIGAGAVVSKDIPPYAIAVGCPIKIIKYRFNESTIKRLLKLKWWDSDFEDLKLIEENFFDVEKYLEIFENSTSDE